MSGIEDIEVVAWGYEDSSPYGSTRLMMVRIDIPGDDQYMGAMWTPLMTVAQHNRIVEQYKRDAERMRDLLCRARAFVDAWDDDSQEFMDLCGDIDNAISQQQTEVKP